MFTRRLPPHEKIPILNKPPPPGNPTTGEKEEQQNGFAGRKAPTASAKKKAATQRPEEFKPPAEYDRHVSFMVYEHFSISKKTIRQLCSTPDGGCDLHIVFYKEMPALPQIGFSCLSYADLWEDQAELQGEKTRTALLDFVLMMPYKHNFPHIPQFELHTAAPKPRQTLTISLRVDEPKAVQICFTFMDQRPTNWFSVKFPPFINDFSLVIGIEKDELQRCWKDEQGVVGGFDYSLDIFTTFGWMKSLQEQQQAGEQYKEEEKEAVTVEAQIPCHYEDRECCICLEKDSETVFHPCGHAIVHRRCLVKKVPDLLDKLQSGTLECYNCREKCLKLVQLRFLGPNCFFCGQHGKCQKFDSYCYPCGCSLGCIDGFRRNVKELNMSLNCVKCNQVIENIQPFYQ